MTTNSSHNKTAELNTFLQHCELRINAQLKKRLPLATQPPQRLHRAMQYAVFNGGKRLRPLLVYATGMALEADLERLDGPAVAVELIHCYSLVHDDLPAMDNDDWRRGQPTCHKAFNEATAILVGDALQTLAFGCLEDIKQVKILALASGSLGMAGGQDMDLENENKTTDLTGLQQTHRLKTGALIEASISLACEASGYGERTEKTILEQFAKNLGLAFQIQDDILDVEGNLNELGKTPGIDASNNKSTYVSILGLAEAKKRLKKHYEAALNALAQLTLNTEHLEAICHFVVERKR